LQAPPEPRGESLDLAQIAFHVEARVRIPCDEQAGTGEVDLGLVARHQFGKAVGRGHQPASRRAKSRSRNPSSSSSAP